MGLRCAIIASAAKGAAARPTDGHLSGATDLEEIQAAAARRRGSRTYNRRVRAVGVNLNSERNLNEQTGTDRRCRRTDGGQQGSNR
ncbi:hypothetical protein BN2475_340096 [Paraburkholderia ribeironis]|uniref:Uncharacterized protein n=1 Tax=Paraburkholderia ribeironis TaxID=1247936 RepID=A0A1N7S433_9BURK|nr:hypothetical protein BN2475_340096 [Paraburkholderia ribeironis]